MTTLTDKEILIGSVIDQIAQDLRDNDLTALSELLGHISDEKLKGYLPEEVFEDPNDYVGMGWIDSRGRP